MELAINLLTTNGNIKQHITILSWFAIIHVETDMFRAAPSSATTETSQMGTDALLLVFWKELLSAQ